MIVVNATALIGFSFGITAVSIVPTKMYVVGIATTVVATVIAVFAAATTTINETVEKLI